MKLATLLAVFAFALGLANAAFAQEKKLIRIGIIGLDTSHVPAFTKIFNNPNATGDLEGFKVVAGFPGGSPDIASSRDRVEGFTKQLQQDFGVKIYSSIEAMLPDVDAVLLESVDGRPHLKQVIPVLKAGKIVFIDKPVAGTLADALMIYELSAKYKVPLFSSSSLRYSTGIASAKNNPKIGKIHGCLTYSPCSLDPTHPDLFWYGVHGVESLYAVMGTGCKTVQRTSTKDHDLVTGTWDDGRVATFRGIRGGKAEYGCLVFGEKGVVPVGGYTGYEPLVVEIAKFFRTGVVPVRPEETIELFAFMEAADESKRQGGAPVTIANVLQKARAENAKRTID